MNISSTSFRIPAFAESIKQYRETGEFPGQSKRLELDAKSAQTTLDTSLDSFQSWKALDEGPSDLLKGRPGEVKIAGEGEGEFTEAQFRGNAQDGELVEYRNEPSRHYGAKVASYTKFGRGELDQVQVTDVDGRLNIDTLTHVDYQFASEGPVRLGGDPVSVRLTPQASTGFQLYRDLA